MLRRKYERKKKMALRRERDFLIKRLRNEWDDIEKGTRREEQMRQAKESAKMVGKGLLALLAIAGVVTVMAVSPNVFAAIGKIRGKRRFAQKQAMHDAIRRLRKNKYVEAKRDTNTYTLKLTSDGADAVFSQALGDLRVRHDPIWDGKWRFVFFDIPNRHKWARDAFRQQLQNIGFYRIQESVFVYPFPCYDELRFLTDVFSISQYVRSLTAQDISDDADLREFFAL